VSGAAAGGRGWGRVAALALATMVLSVVQPALLIFVPLALLVVALPPRPPLLLALAAFIVWLTFGQPQGGGTLWYFERGWALLLGAWFVLLVALLPGWRFLARALAALAATTATAVALLLLNRGGLAQLDYAIAQQLRGAAASAVATWTQAFGLGRVGEELRRTAYAAAELQVKLYPAMLALASLAALAVAWWAFSRLARREAAPLAPLREFRFSDQLVWLLIAAVLLVALPLDAVGQRVGENLFTFMAVLYALRGAAVLLVVSGTPGPVGVVLGAVVLVFLYPLVMATTFVVGLSDTWLDIRKRRAEAASRPRS
jgi:hypothetical protein